MNKLVDIIAVDAKRICRKVDLSEIRGKTILITGASGLIGGYFLACLKEFSVVEQDLFNIIAVMQNDPPHYLMDFLNYQGVNVIRGDLTSHEFCKGLPQADYIIHAAGYGQPGRFMENPIKTLQINTAVVFSLFEKLSSQGKFLFISSGEVYTGLKNLPYKESEIGTTNTNHPRSCYIEGKRCGEAICNAFRVKGVNAKSARLAATYGPGTRQGDLRALNSFIQKAIISRRIDLLDQGKANRTYCYISDAVEIMWNILFFGKESVYNVGGDFRITIGELALKVGNYLNVPVLFPVDSQGMAGAPNDVYLDTTKVQNEFGKTDYVTIDEGLARTIEWQQELYRNIDRVIKR